MTSACSPCGSVSPQCVASDASAQAANDAADAADAGSASPAQQIGSASAAANQQLAAINSALLSAKTDENSTQAAYTVPKSGLDAASQSIAQF